VEGGPMTIRYLAFASVCVLAACGSASDSTTFHVPAGYVQQASIGPFMQIWKTNDDKSIIMLMALPVKSDLHQAMSQTDIKDSNINEQKDITICNGQPAVYMDATGTATTAGSAGTTRRGHVEMVATAAGGKTYVAMYVRELKAPVDPAADAAIKNICPKN
jgi:hypothetical protein